MARRIELVPNKTYASVENVEKAIARFPAIVAADINYFIMPVVG